MSEAIGRDDEYGLRIETSAATLPDEMTGSASYLGVVVNAVRIGIAECDVLLTNTNANSIIHMGEYGEIEPLIFEIEGELVGQAVDDWTLRISHDDDDNVKSLRGNGILPKRVTSNDIDEIRQSVLPGRVYFYQLEASTNGTRITSSRKMFGVNRETSIALELCGGAFRVNSYELTGQAKQLLSDAAKIMQQHPDEIIRIYGHTDSTGTQQRNQALSENRANAAFAYLTREHNLSPDRFIVEGFGEDRPVASNAMDTGRERNRRVEIVGKLTEVERAHLYETRTSEPLAAMNGLAVELDSSGQFTIAFAADEQDSISLKMSDELGQGIQTVLDLPRFAISTGRCNTLSESHCLEKMFLESKE